MATIDLATSKPCPLCSRLVTKDGRIGGEVPVTQCDREGCPLREEALAVERRAREAAERHAAEERKRQEAADAAFEERRERSRARREAFFARIGAAWKRWRTRNKPEGKVERLRERLDALHAKRQGVQEELAGLDEQIRAKKKDYEAARGARATTLRSELKLLLRQYKSVAGVFAILNEKEMAVEGAIGALRATSAYGERGLDEDAVDRIAVDLDEAAEAADHLADAHRDLARAGQRQSSILDETSDGEFDALLAEFDTPEPHQPESTEKIPENDLPSPLSPVEHDGEQTETAVPKRLADPE